MSQENFRKALSLRLWWGSKGRRCGQSWPRQSCRPGQGSEGMARQWVPAESSSGTARTLLWVRVASTWSHSSPGQGPLSGPGSWPRNRQFAPKPRRWSTGLGTQNRLRERPLIDLSRKVRRPVAALLGLGPGSQLVQLSGEVGHGRGVRGSGHMCEAQP